MARSRSSSSIEQLGVQELVGRLLEIPGTTYEQIVEQVKTATGKTITKSALSRYHTVWRLRENGYQAMEQQLGRLEQMLAANPDLDLKQGAMAIFWKKIVHRMADATATFDKADLLEVAQVLLKAKRLDQLDAAARAKQTIDRPSVYLDCLGELTDYLTRTAPTALGALQQAFDGFLDETRKKYAPLI